ncbi:MAG TPA: transglycosylase SLT domain-containing protein [Pyrinomonadaceae bacterium]
MFTRFRPILVCLLLLTPAIAVQAQSDEKQHQTIRSAVEAGNWLSVISETTKVKTANPNLFQTRNYDYLLARAAEQTGDKTLASGQYQGVIARQSPLSGYSLWHLSRMARSTGDLVQEREHLRRLTAGGSNSLLYDAAVLRLAESFFESGDYPSAASSARLPAGSKNVSLARELSLLLGQSLLRDGKAIEARDVFIKLLMSMPDASRPDDFALQAVRELDQLEKNAGQNQPSQLTEADHLLRASVYQFNRDFSGARFHYQMIQDRFPQSGALANATFQIGRGFYQERKYDEAVKYFQKVADQFGQSPSAREALGFLGSTYVRLRRTDDAVAAYKLIIDRFPNESGLDRAYLNIIDAFHEAGRHTEALNWVAQTRTRFKADAGSNLALFSQLRIHLAQSAWQEVVKDADELLKLSDLGGLRVPGGTTSVEVSFLKAIALEQLGRTDEAISAYLAIPDGRNDYFGSRATLRLIKLATNEKTRPLTESRRTAFLAAAKTASAAGQLEQARTAAQAAFRLTSDEAAKQQALLIVKSAYEGLPSHKVISPNLVSLIKTDGGNADADTQHRVLANTLIDLGLYDEGMPEFLASRSAQPTPTSQTTGNADKPGTMKAASPSVDEDYTVAVYSLRGGLPNRAVRFAEQFWRSVPADYVIELAPSGLIELLYPTPYRDSLLKHAPPRNVDPRFVLSIARQESRYQADAKSAAAARGMMQFIVSTANEIAAQLKISNFNQDGLYEPDTAVLFGSQYLGNLFQLFPNQPEAVAASYNGGEDNMTRWMGRSRAREPERYVPEIGFAQSKDYVYRVMSNFWSYQKLYDAQLQPVVR